VTPSDDDPTSTAGSPDGFLTGHAVLTNAVGLHARPSVKLTQTAKRFAAKVEIALSADGPWTDCKSPVRVMRLKAARGATLFFRCAGSDETEALAALRALVERGFDEDGAGPAGDTPR